MLVGQEDPNFLRGPVVNDVMGYGAARSALECRQGTWGRTMTSRRFWRLVLGAVVVALVVYLAYVAFVFWIVPPHHTVKP